MNRTIRRMRRNPDLYISPNTNLNNYNIENDGYLIRKIPRSLTSPFNNSTLAQRVASLEDEVADINVAFAEHINELENQNRRVNTIENRIGIDSQRLPITGTEPPVPITEMPCDPMYPMYPYDPYCNVYNPYGYPMYPYDLYNPFNPFNPCNPCNPYVETCFKEECRKSECCCKKKKCKNECNDELSSDNASCLNSQLNNCECSDECPKKCKKKKCCNQCQSDNNDCTNNLVSLIKTIQCCNCKCNCTSSPQCNDNWNEKKNIPEVINNGCANDYSLDNENCCTQITNSDLYDPYDNIHADYNHVNDTHYTNLHEDFIYNNNVVNYQNILNNATTDYNNQIINQTEQIKNQETINDIQCSINPSTNLTVINQPKNTYYNSMLAWASKISGININEGKYVTKDSCNNIVVAACSKMPQTSIIIYKFDNISQKIINTSSYGVGLIIKYDPSGCLLWVAKIENNAGDAVIESIITDSCDNIIITGYYSSGTLQIYNSNDKNIINLIEPEVINSFIIVYDQLGEVKWSTFISSSGTIKTTSISVNILGDIFVTGYYNGSNAVFMNANGNIGGSLPTSIADDIIIAKYNNSGTVLWITKIGDIIPIPTITGNDRGTCITISPDGSIVLTGYFMSNPAILYNGPDGLTPSGIMLNNSFESSANILVAKYSDNGIALWATQLSGSLDDNGLAVSVDKCNNIIVTGFYQSENLDVLNTPNGSISSGLILNNSTPGTSECFIVKYNENGIALWATKISGSLSDSGNSINCDQNNNILITGSYSSNPVTLYNSDNTLGPTLTNLGNKNSFIAKYSSDGLVKWASKQGGSSDDCGKCIIGDNENNIITVGKFQSSPFNIYNSENVLELSLQNTGSSNGYVLKYIDYGQILQLVPSLYSSINKTITLGEFNGSGSLVISERGLLKDCNNINVKGILLNMQGATITLIWNCNAWVITYFWGVTLIYYLS